MSDLSGPRAVILGLEGPHLSAAEQRLLAETQPLGVILFRRNCESPAQIRALVDAVRACLGRPDAPVLIDQEGGRVARLRPPAWPALPPARAIGQLAALDPEAGLAAARLQGAAIGAMCAPLGITVACAPVLDLEIAGTHDVIGDRAYGRDPALVAALGRTVMDGLLEQGVLPVIKHLPGHGRTTEDSHAVLPRVAAPRATLEAEDFQPFRTLAHAPWGMTAHVVYEAIDPERAGSVSPRVIAEVIRGAIGFDGVLVADDITMEALTGSPAMRAQATLAAGCDVTLHCSGRLAEMEAVARAVPELSPEACIRLMRAEAERTRRAGTGDADAAGLAAALARLLKRPAAA